MGRVAEGAGIAQRLVAGGHLQAAAVDVLGQVLGPQVPGLGDLGDADAARRALDLAVLDRDRRDRHLEQLRADLGQALGQLLARGRDRAAGHDHAARAPGPGRIGRVLGVAEDQLHLVDVDAQDLVGDLGQRGLQPLAVGVHAEPELEPAVGGDARARLLVAGHHGHAPGGVDRGAVGPLLAVDGEADPDPPAVGLAAGLAFAQGVEVDRGDRAA